MSEERVSGELREWIERRFAVPRPAVDKVRSLSLAAGARGLGWTTTRSLAGSTMETDNAGLIRRLEDGTVAIRALVPDVSIFHAPAADAHGNVLVAPPLMENLSGALAARRGAIVT